LLAFFLPQAGKSTQDTEVSSLKQLLDEFADEGVVDIQLHNHELEKPGLAAGSDGSGLSCSMLQLMHLCTKTITKMRLACYVRPEGDITYFIKPKPSQARCGSTQESNKMLLLLILIRDGGVVDMCDGYVQSIAKQKTFYLSCYRWQTHYSWTAPTSLNGLKYSSVASAFNVDVAWHQPCQVKPKENKTRQRSLRA